MAPETRDEPALVIKPRLIGLDGVMVLAFDSFLIVGATATGWPHGTNLVWFLLVILLGGALWTIKPMWVRVIVTEDRVIVKDPTGARRSGSVDRSRVAAIRRMSYWTVFGDKNGNISCEPPVAFGPVTA